MGAGPRKRNTKSRKRSWTYLTDEELRSIVCHLFVSGCNADEIAVQLQTLYRETQFKRQDSYRIVRDAGMQGLFSFALRNDRERVLEHRIRERATELKTLEVIQTAWAADVAEHAAMAVLDWCVHRAAGGQTSIRIGLMGGNTIMTVCRALARRLAALELDKKSFWPELIFQALVVGDNVREPLEDPAAFFTYFADTAINPLKRKYVSLHGPVYLEPNFVQHYTESTEFRALREEARSSDMVLVSAGTFDDAHSFLGALKESSSDTWGRLSSAGCKGDLGRLPIGIDGPMSFDAFHPCILLDGMDLQEMVKEGKRVMLVAAPCGECSADKSSIIQTLLQLRGRGCALFSDLVCDSRSARNMSMLTKPAP